MFENFCGVGMPLDAEGRRRRARLAALQRHHPDQPELTEAERRRFKVSAAERYVQRLVDDFPPLSAEQRARLAVLLLGGEATVTSGVLRDGGHERPPPGS
jgi:hypothetical protein